MTRDDAVLIEAVRQNAATFQLRGADVRAICDLAERLGRERDEAIEANRCVGCRLRAAFAAHDAGEPPTGKTP